MDTVMAGFNTTVRQMTEMSQRKNNNFPCLDKVVWDPVPALRPKSLANSFRCLFCTRVNKLLGNELSAGCSHRRAV